MKVPRIAVIGGAIVAGIGAMFLVATSGSEPEPPPHVEGAAPAPVRPLFEMEGVLVASRDIAFGTMLNDGDSVWMEWPKQSVGFGAIRRSEEAGAQENIRGAIARGSFIQGEPLRREKLVKGTNSGFLSALLPAGSRAVAINIDASGGSTAGGFILPNDRVDVVRTSGSSDGMDSETILTNMRVLAIGQNIEEKNGERVVTGSNATLEADPAQAEALILAQRTGQITLVLRSMMDTVTKPKSDIAEAAPETERSMTIVRYGVASNGGKR